VADSGGTTLEYIPTPDENAVMSPRIPWRYDRTTEPWLRWLMRVGGAVLYGTALLVVAGGVAAVGAVALEGSTTVRLLVVVLALVGGPVSLLYLLPVLGDAEQRRPLSLGESALDRRERVVAAICGAAAVTVTFVVDPRLAGGLLLVGLASWLLAAVCASRGHLDTETATVTTRYREWDLDGVTGFDTRRVGPLAVITFDAAGSGSTGRLPTFLLVPRAVEPDISQALDAMTAGDRGEREPAREPNRLVRAVATLFAALAGAGAVGVPTIDGLPGALGWYLSVVCLLFAGLFLAVARAG